MYGLTGAVALVVDLRAAPLAASAAAVLFAGVLWLELRRQVEQHRRTRRHRLRRQIGTAALVSAGLWVVIALLRALRDAIGGGEDPIQSGGQLADTPWPGAFLVAGLVAVGAIALITVATVTSRRRRSAANAPAPAAAGDGR